MNLAIVGFSQDVDLQNPKEVKYFLVCRKGDVDHRFRIQEETMQDILKAVYAEGEDDGFPPEVATRAAVAFDEEDEEVDPEEFASRFGEDTPESEEEIASI